RCGAARGCTRRRGRPAQRAGSPVYSTSTSAAAGILSSPDRRVRPARAAGCGADPCHLAEAAGHEQRPTLGAGTEPPSGLAVEVLVERDGIVEMRIRPRALVAETRPAPGRVGDEQAREPRRDLLRHLSQVHEPARSGRALYAQLVSVEV